METRSRSIADWMHDVARGYVQLPRFQRGEAWNHELVAGFFNAILKKRPLGVFLILEVDPHHQPFKIRPIKGAPNGSERCQQHLLDGQQRLTAIWRTFKDNYDRHTFYLTFSENAGIEDTRVEAIPRKGQDHRTIGNPIEEYKRRRIPMRIFAPGDEGVNARIEWRQAVKDAEDQPAGNRLDIRIEQLRSLISGTQIPFFSMPQDTSPDDAIDIFIETNRSSVRLSHYDLAVAQMESDTGESLQEKVDALIEDDAPAIKELEGNSKDVGDLVLKVQCLREGKKPTLSNYKGLDFGNINEDWDLIVAGIRRTVELLSDLRIWSQDRLPTSVPLRVLPPLMRHMPDRGTSLANATSLIKRYLWVAFLSDRYDRQANARLKEDFDQLRDRLDGIGTATSNASRMPLALSEAEEPNDYEIRNAPWPSGRSRLAKAILAACSLCGANDIASNEVLKAWDKREHHHIFPKAVLRECHREPNLALNCMLLRPPTNRDWARNLPGDFLIRTIQTSAANVDAETEITARLESHLVPAGLLLRVKNGTQEAQDIPKAYERFLDARLRLVNERIKTLLRTGEPSRP